MLVLIPLAADSGIPFFDQILRFIEQIGGPAEIVSMNVYSNQTVSSQSYGASIQTVDGRTYNFGEVVPRDAIVVIPGSTEISAGGGSGNFDVKTGAQTPWTAASLVAWVTITEPPSPGDAVGPAPVSFTVAANTTGLPRTGNIQVYSIPPSGNLASGKATFVVNQQG